MEVFGRSGSIVGILVAGVLVWIYALVSEKTAVEFRAYDAAAVEHARAAKQPIVIYVNSNVDRTCQELNKSVLRDERLIAALEPFACFMLIANPNSATYEQVATQKKIVGVPTFLFTDAKGVELQSMVGPQSVETLLAAAARASKP